MDQQGRKKIIGLGRRTREDSKVESNSHEIPDRGETSGTQTQPKLTGSS